MPKKIKASAPYGRATGDVFTTKTAVDATKYLAEHSVKPGPDGHYYLNVGPQQFFDVCIRPMARIYKRAPLSKIDRARAEQWLVAEVMALPAAERRFLADAIKTHPDILSSMLPDVWRKQARAVGVDPQTHLEGETLTFTGIDDLPSLTLTQRQIIKVCADIEKLLLAKNRKYGDSALNPKRIFSKASPIEQIHVRIDDKLSRIESAQLDEDEDVIDDLIGYLVLLKVAMMRQGVKALPSDQPEGEVYVARVTKEGDDFLADFPDALGCQTFAKTMPELARLAKEALEGWLEANLADRVVPSPPRFRGGPGMQLRVAIDPELSRKLRDARDQVRRPSGQPEGKRKGR